MMAARGWNDAEFAPGVKCGGGERGLTTNCKARPRPVTPKPQITAPLIVPKARPRFGPPRLVPGQESRRDVLNGLTMLIR